MTDGSDSPPDWVKTATDPDRAIRGLERTGDVSVWDLPEDYQTLVAVASRVDVSLSRDDGRGEIEEKLANYFTDDG